MRRRSNESPLVWHWVFETAISLKFLDGVLEVIGSVVLFFAAQEALNHVLYALLTSELLEDPKDVVANALLGAFRGLSLGQQHFAAVYLLLHGIIKIGLVVALWTRQLWAYPLAAVVLILFTIYQLYLFVATGSLLQLFLIVIDVVVLALLHFEYRRVTG